MGKIARTTRTVKISDYMHTWLNSFNDVQMNETSKKKHARRIAQWILPYLDKPLDQIIAQEVQTWIYTTLANKGAGPSAVVNADQTFRALINHAVKFGVIESTPHYPVDVPKAEPKVALHS